MFKVSTFVFLILLVSISTNADINGELIPRIEKIGKVCISGMECLKQLTTISETLEDDDLPVISVGMLGPVEKNYKIGCGTCHDAGVAGAPILGNADHWSPRVAKGMNVLYDNSINGFSVMPTKGMCFSCSDDEIKAIVDYMVGASRP